MGSGATKGEKPQGHFCERECVITGIHPKENQIVYDIDSDKITDRFYLNYGCDNFAQIYEKICRQRAYKIQYVVRNYRQYIVNVTDVSIHQVNGKVLSVCPDKTGFCRKDVLEVILGKMTKLPDGRYCRLVIDKNNTLQVGKEYLFHIKLNSSDRIYLITKVE